MGGLTGCHFTLLSKVQLENNPERSEIEFIPTYTHPPLDVLESIGEVVGRQRGGAPGSSHPTPESHGSLRNQHPTCLWQG